jgi:hypothetical protein
MEDVVITKEGGKGKEHVLEKVHTLGNLENILSLYDQPILDPLEEVVDLKLIPYNRRK